MYIGAGGSSTSRDHAVSPHCARRSLPSLSISPGFRMHVYSPFAKIVPDNSLSSWKSIEFYFTDYSFLNLILGFIIFRSLLLVKQTRRFCHFLLRSKILRVIVKIASVSAGVRYNSIGMLWSLSFRWFLFSRISGRAKMFHRGAGSPPVPHWLRQQKHGKQFQFGVCPTHADDALFGHYYRCYIHRFFQLHAGGWSRGSVPWHEKSLSSKDRRMVALKYTY